MKPSSAADAALQASAPQGFPPQALPHDSMQPVAGRTPSSRAASSLQAPHQMRVLCRSPSLRTAQSTQQTDRPCCNDSIRVLQCRAAAPMMCLHGHPGSLAQTPDSDISCRYCSTLDLYSPLSGDLSALPQKPRTRVLMLCNTGRF